eukprot:1161561-Pelagomonas_calceolata.AAC.3
MPDCQYLCPPEPLTHSHPSKGSTFDAAHHADQRSNRRAGHLSDQGGQLGAPYARAPGPYNTYIGSPVGVRGPPGQPAHHSSDYSRDAVMVEGPLKGSFDTGGSNADRQACLQTQQGCHVKGRVGMAQWGGE